MFLENLVIDAADPPRALAFWGPALGLETLSDGPEGSEGRLHLTEDAYLDLCFPRVEDPVPSPQRLHLDLLGGPQQEQVAARLRELGASDLDIGQGEVPWTVMADPLGTAFCVMEEREAYAATGPIAALPLDVADPERDAEFWQRLSGWREAPGAGVRTLRHPSGRGPLLELCPEPAPKAGGKNPIHLDIRLEAGDDIEQIVAQIHERGGAELHPDWGELPWRVFTDPSGNEFCILPAY